MEDAFKVCTACKKVWLSREEFLGDPETAIIGYQGALAGPEHGFFFINHLRKNCETTLAVKVSEFADLYDGPLLRPHKSGKDPCPQYCFYHNNISDRPEACECRYVRHVMQRIKDWPK